MNTTLANLNHSELNNNSNNTTPMAPAIPQDGTAAGTIRPEGTRRDSLLSILLRSLSAVAF